MLNAPQKIRVLGVGPECCFGEIGPYGGLGVIEIMLLKETGGP